MIKKIQIIFHIVYGSIILALSLFIVNFAYWVYIATPINFHGSLYENIAIFTGFDDAVPRCVDQHKDSMINGRMCRALAIRKWLDVIAKEESQGSLRFVEKIGLSNERRQWREDVKNKGIEILEREKILFDKYDKESGIDKKRFEMDKGNLFDNLRELDFDWSQG